MKHVVLLTNFIPPYRIPLFSELQDRLPGFRIFVSTKMERNRNWDVDYKALPVVRQRTLTVRQRWRHPAGFQERSYLHLPLDTLILLWREQPDAIISGELGFRSLQAALYCMIFNCRLVLWATLSEHTEKGRGVLREPVRRWLVGRADKIIVNGNSGARYIQKLGGLLEKIVIIPYVSDRKSIGECHGRDEIDRERTLVYIGQLTERKGILPFLRALIRWQVAHPDRNIRFVVVGEGPKRPEIEQLAETCQFEINTPGFVRYDSIPEYLIQGDILVLPSLADEWGLVVNEAMAMCLPVLGSVYSQAVDELVDDGKNGWKFVPDSAASLDQAISRALETPAEKLIRMGEKARESVKHLTAQFAAERMIGVLESLQSNDEVDC